MATKTEVAVQEEAQLPALAPTPGALGNIDSGDISLPRLYKGEYQSGLVQDDVVPKGCIFVAAGADDPDPNVVAKLGESVRVHVLSAYKNKSAKIDGEFTTFAFNDPAAPEDADVGFHYVLILPEVDPDVPVKITMSRTSVPAARKINFLLLKNAERPAYELAFNLNTKAREKSSGGEKFKWFVWEARQVDADPAHVEAAAKLSELANAPRNDIERSAGTSNGPAI